MKAAKFKEHAGRSNENFVNADKWCSTLTSTDLENDRRQDAVSNDRFIRKLETQRIYHGNFLEMVKFIPNQSIDILIADPPYNASKGGAWSMEHGILPGFGGDWAKIHQVWDDMTLPEYYAFTLTWLTEAKRVLKQTGSMWVHGTYHNIGITNIAMQISRY